MNKHNEQFPESISIKPMCPLCSYCGSKMNFTSSQVKRRVPQGAVDLDIYDETYYWQCERCNNISNEFLLNCHCGKILMDYPIGNKTGSSYPSCEVAVNELSGLFGYICTYKNARDDDYSYECPYCIHCRYCRGKLEVSNIIRTHNFFEDNSSEVKYSYYHENCFAQKQKADEQKRLKAELELQQKREEFRQKESSKATTYIILKTVMSTVSTFVLAIIVYLIVGMVGCTLRSSNFVQYNLRGDLHEYSLKAFNEEAIYFSLPIFLIGILITVFIAINTNKK